MVSWSAVLRVSLSVIEFLVWRFGLWFAFARLL